MKLLIAVMGFSLAIAAVDSAANALVPRLALSSETLVTDVQYRTCTRDDRGWRYMRGESRIRCRPSRPDGLDWIWRVANGRSGWWHNGERRWHD